MARRELLIPAALAALMFGLMLGGQLLASPPAPPSPTPMAQDVISNDPSIGPADAPIVIQEYADYACDHCARWDQEGVRERLIHKYGNNLRFVRHDYAVQSELSRPAALAARCAGDQGKYWQYHDVLSARFPALEVSDLKKYATKMGLDTAAFNQCLDSQKFFEQVAGGLKNGMDHGIFATPEFLVNNFLVKGGQSFEVFTRIIDRLLATPKYPLR